MRSTPSTITYRGRQYQLVEALTEDDLRNSAQILHDLAMTLRPSIASSDAAQALDSMQSALTNMVRSNKLLIEEEAILPKGVPGNSARIMALVTDAADSVDELKERLDRLSGNIGVWALKIDKHMRGQESERSLSHETKMTTPQESKQFSHLF